MRSRAAAHTLSRFGPVAAEAVPTLKERLTDPQLQEEERIEIIRALLAISEQQSSKAPKLK